MTDLVVAVGLVLVIEGLLWALAPGLGRTLLATMAASPERDVRRAGWVAVGLGVLIVWLMRG